jgi:ABC-type glycerol-3-phosphate transport system permease component
MSFTSRSSSARISWTPTFWTIGMSAFILLWILPFLTMAMSSFKDDQEALAKPFGWPRIWSIEAYVSAWNGLGYSSLVWNSVLYSVAGTMVAILLAVVPAYALSRFQIKFRRAILVLLLIPIMLPQQTVIIPLFTLFRSLGLIDTRLGVILIHGAFGMPLELLILVGFISNIPKELEHAARLDGCTDIDILRRVVIPLSVPAIAVGFVLNFIDIWKEYFFSLVFLSSEKLMPLTVGIVRVTNDRYFRAVNVPAAAVIMAQVPIVLLFIFSYRWITQGIYTGSVKN